MKPISASQARNRFGPLLARLGDEPVAVERYGKTVAYLVPAHRKPVDEAAAARREARLRQAAQEQGRLNRHLRVAVELLCATPAQARARVKRASEEVTRWEREGLCSSDYIRRWRKLLNLPLPRLALEMNGDLDGWGPALRQNSPWR